MYCSIQCRKHCGRVFNCCCIVLSSSTISILATHSPIIISSCKNARLLEIDPQHQIHEKQDSYAYSVADVLSYTQRSDDIPGDLRQQEKAFEVAMNAKDYQNAKEIIGRMIGQYGEDNTFVKKGKFKLKLSGIEV